MATKCAVIAHRGARDEAPENTLPAISEALLLAVHGVEFDVDLTEDDVPIVVHQETLAPDSKDERLELASRQESRAWTLNRSLNATRRLDAGSWFNATFKNTTIPTLTEVFSLRWGNTTAFMELKDPHFWEKPVENHPQRVIRAVKKPVQHFLESGGKLMAISFDPRMLQLWLSEFPTVPCIRAVWNNLQGQHDKVIAESVSTGVVALTVAETMVLQNHLWIDRAHEHSLGCYVYEVSPAAGEPVLTQDVRIARWQKLRSLGVDGIFSDTPRALLEFMES